MLVALHEAAAERSPCKIQSLEDPDPSHQNDQRAATDNPEQAQDYLRQAEMLRAMVATQKAPAPTYSPA
jgi:type II secretory pathway component HofQ